MTMKEIRGHGLSGYRYGCRCEACGAAKADSMRRYNDRRRADLLADPSVFPHGSVSTFALGCRCEQCSTVGPEDRRRRYAIGRGQDRNRQKPWTGAEMSLAMDRRSDGRYVRSATALAVHLGRTAAAVKQLRNRCRSDPKYAHIP